MSGRPSSSRPAGPGDRRSALADRLHSASIHLLRRLRRVDEAAGLSAPRMSALSVLVFGGSMPITKLAAVEQVRPPCMTRLIQELEAEGLVRRERDDKDRRVVHVHPTPRAVRLMKRGRGRRVELLESMLDGVDAAGLATLEQAVELLEGVLRSARQD